MTKRGRRTGAKKRAAALPLCISCLFVIYAGPQAEQSTKNKRLKNAPEYSAGKLTRTSFIANALVRTVARDAKSYSLRIELVQFLSELSRNSTLKAKPLNSVACN